MNRSMMMAIALFPACIQAMEEKENSLNITVYGTSFNLNKGNMFDAYSDGKKKADFIVVEEYAKQRKNGPDGLARRDFPQNNDYNILEVTESRVGVSIYGDVFYERYKPYKLYRWKDEAVEEALKDLKLCYKEVLAKAVQVKKEKLAKSIVLPALGIGLCTSLPFQQNNYYLENEAAQATITAIFEFLKNNPGSYDRIELFIEEDFKFDLYKEFLAKILSKKMYC
jgi:hypothetical protein